MMTVKNNIHLNSCDIFSVSTLEITEKHTYNYCTIWMKKQR